MGSCRFAERATDREGSGSPHHIPPCAQELIEEQSSTIRTWEQHALAWERVRKPPLLPWHGNE